MSPSASFQRAAVITALLMWAAATHAAQSSSSIHSAAFDSFVERLAADWMRADPVAATVQQYFSGAQQDALDRRLTARDSAYGIPIGRPEQRAYVKRAQAALQRLKLFPRDTLDPVQRASAAAIEWQLEDAVRIAAVEESRYVFDQFTGLHVSLVNFLSQAHPLRNARDVDNYLARLRQLAPVLERGIAESRHRARLGVIPPKFILQATLDGIDRFMSAAPPMNVLVTSLNERASQVSAIPQDVRAKAQTAAEDIVRDAILPAFRRIRTLLQDQMAIATDDAAIRTAARETQTYATFLRSNTTTQITPEEVHALGLSEVERIEKEMDTLLRGLGYTDGTVKERFEKLEASLQPAKDPDPRPAILAEDERILRDAQVRAASLFDLRPKASVRVEREPAFTEKTAAAHYSGPAPDGTLPGIVWIPLPGPTFRILELRTLTYHEGVPGHHFQIALQQESPVLPRFRQKRVFGRVSAFAEGWALYAEHLVAESGWYESDPQGRLGQLSDELFRARRLVVDTGLHVKHWTRQQAIDYGIPASEVDRYVVWPGQACAYKIGELEILAQREKARAVLGEQFSMQQFHDWLLQTGTVPLEVLRQVIDEHLARRSSSETGR